MKPCVFMLVGMASLSLSACGGPGTAPIATSTPGTANEWTWASGADFINQQGSYGTQGAPASSNVPGSRYTAVGSTDATGNFWLFGGSGSDWMGTYGDLNDLWKYSSGQWTWIGGSNGVDQPGIYATQGTPSLANFPGARESAVSWTDGQGNFWLFAGLGYDSTGTWGQLNDQWKYGAGQWTWVGGPIIANQPGTYGTQGTPSLGNIPGARSGAVTWTDASGNFWLFGGNGYDADGEYGFLNDLWKYSNGEWTWMNGSNECCPSGTYGTQGIAAAPNVPGSRISAATSTDAAGNFWLFGGVGLDSAGNLGFLNDLWKYSAGQWTWMGGSNVFGQPGVYGTLGTAASSNIPGARAQAVSWTDSAGNFWLFGGNNGFDPDSTILNDLWKYSAGQWTWVGGSNGPNEAGTFGTQGTAASSDVPGARYGALVWTDTTGNFWLFGGVGYDSTQAYGTLNDLWKYQP
jgi:hypothetical protein